MTFGAVPVNVPCAGCVATTYVNASPSTSDPVSVIAAAVSSAVVTDCALATGASLTAVTVIDTVAAADVRAASLTVKVKLSGPLYLRARRLDSSDDLPAYAVCRVRIKTTYVNASPSTPDPCRVI